MLFCKKKQLYLKSYFHRNRKRQLNTDFKTAGRSGSMRRARDSYQYQPIPRAPTEDVLEHENERMAEELGGKISTLKHMSIEIGNEVRYQDKILRGLDDDVDRSSGFLDNTMGRILKLGKGNHNYYIFYLFLFSVFIFFLLYIVLKFR